MLILVRCPKAGTAVIPGWGAGPMADRALCSSGSELLLTVLVRAKPCVLTKLCSPALGEEHGEPPDLKNVEMLVNGVNFGEVQLVLLSYFWLETKVREPSP